jgi:penicillin-binding protein 2
VTPHVVLTAEQAGSERTPERVWRRFAPPPPQPTGVDPAALAVVQDGLYAATHAENGTASGVFASFPVPVAGKTGTAEKVVDLPGYRGLMDQSWFCAYGPSNDAKLVVCTVIENGGHGGEVAAPATLKVFEHFFKTQATFVQVGKSD